VKTAIALLFLALGLAHAQGCPENSPDVWLWNYSGDQLIGGTIQLYQTAQVQGSAYTSNGIPMPGFPSSLPPCTWTTPWGRQVGGVLGITNVTPQCNGINFSLVSSGFSERTDGNQDHLSQTGWAWGSNPGDGKTPAVQDLQEAGSLFGNIGRSANWGTPYRITNVQGLCNNSYKI
jgi:hypothetical protein